MWICFLFFQNFVMDELNTFQGFVKVNIHFTQRKTKIIPLTNRSSAFGWEPLLGNRIPPILSKVQIKSYFRTGQMKGAKRLPPPALKTSQPVTIKREAACSAPEWVWGRTAAEEQRGALSRCIGETELRCRDRHTINSRRYLRRACMRYGG